MLGMGVVLLAMAGVLSLVGAVMFAVAAFRVSVVWGLLVLFVPFAGLVFLVKYWAQAKRGFLVSLAGSAVAVLGFVIVSAGIAATAKAQLAAFAAEAQSQVKPETARQRHAAPRPVADAPEPPVQEPAAPPAPERGLAVRSLGEPRGFPDVSPETADPGEISTKDLARHVGEELLFVEKDGGSVWGKLVEVSPKMLRIERRLHGGSVQYDLPLADIRTVRADG
jgi:hypothetical protein